MVSDGQTVHFWPHSVIHNRKAVHLTSLKLLWEVNFRPPLMRQNFRDASGLNCYPHPISCPIKLGGVKQSHYITVWCALESWNNGSVPGVPFSSLESGFYSKLWDPNSILVQRSISSQKKAAGEDIILILAQWWVIFDLGKFDILIFQNILLRSFKKSLNFSYTLPFSETSVLIWRLS